MSFLQRCYYRTWVANQKMECKKTDNPFNEAKEQGIERIEEVEDPSITPTRPTPFTQLIHELTQKLCRDYENNVFELSTNKDNKDEPSFADSGKKFMAVKNALIESLKNIKTDENDPTYENWFSDCSPQIYELLAALDEISQKRTLTARAGDFLWKLADAVVGVLLCVGIAELFKLGGFPAAFAFLATSKGVLIAGAGMLALTKVPQLFWNERRQLEQAIKMEAHGAIESSCGAKLRSTFNTCLGSGKS